jgi:hypothetical protein
MRGQPRSRVRSSSRDDGQARCAEHAVPGVHGEDLAAVVGETAHSMRSTAASREGRHGHRRRRQYPARQRGRIDGPMRHEAPLATGNSAFGADAASLFESGDLDDILLIISWAGQAPAWEPSN